MAYATASELEARIGSDTALRLSADSGTSVVDARLTDAITEADGTIDMYLSTRWLVPLTASYLLTVAKQWSLALADYNLRIRRPPVADHAVEKRNEILAILKALSKGEGNLPTATAVDSTTSEDPTGVFGYNERFASRANLAGL